MQIECENMMKDYKIRTYNTHVSIQYIIRWLFADINAAVFEQRVT